MPGERARAAGLSQVFAVAEFRALWGAELISVAGDQLARVALSVLVYGRTGSAAWAAVVYALTFLPALLGGVLLGGLADRHRRRELMIVVDLLRAVLVGAMAVPGMPLWALCTLLVVVVLLASPHGAAQAALLPAVLPEGDAYERGMAVRQITNQAVQLLAFTMGGALLLVLSPAAALGLNAVSFVASAVILRKGVAARDTPRDDVARSSGRAPATEILRDGARAIRMVLSDPRRRSLLCLVWLVGFYVVPEGLAAPYATSLGGGPAAIGLLMAADPAGSVLGAFLFTRLVPAERRPRLIGWLAVAAGLPLAACVLSPNLPVSILLWALTGAFATAYLVQAQASFVRATPDAQRGRAVGVAASGLVAAQGLAVLLGGLLAERWSPTTAVAVCGAAGVVASAVAGYAWWQAGQERRTAADAGALECG
ncbi:MFS transporter [Pseudonocardia acidicola]|uniref:MFS transporter n=1 Tax=Pseudonocardia acidicola TaxID=2724939 RepID=A0ABX1S7M1_9PSEU|nr:MFS transporter [Pseudonocardia acidicola]NMH96468.1 MFS transporter [Pseudonocardia acidicola]